MVSNRVLAAVFFGCFGAFIAVVAAAPASALITYNGDWIISGSQSYTDERIVVVSTNTTDGQIHILAGGSLTLENTAVVLPNNRTLDNEGTLWAGNSTFDGPNFQLYLRGPSAFLNVRIINATYDNSGRIGTWVTSPAVTFENTTWTRAAGRTSATRFAPIHLRTVMDFQGNYVGQGATVYYDLAVISGSATIDISGNTFSGENLFGYRSSGIIVSSVQHTGSVTYLIHDNVFRDNDDAVDLRAASPSTSYFVWNNRFNTTRWAALEIGDEGNSRFAANLTVSNNSFNIQDYGGFGGSFMMRAYGSLTNPPTINVDLADFTGPGTGIFANSITVVVRNSVFNGNGTFYSAGTDGHIMAYSTLDASAQSETTGTRGSVEHMAFLNITSIVWQGAIPIYGDLVSLTNATGATNIQIDPQTWAPSFAVWWGRYQGQPFKDNRNLLPLLIDDTRTFGCTPVQFFFTETMSAMDIECTDDAIPSVSLSQPPPSLLWQNRSDLAVAGNASDWGAGLSNLEWSFDNASWNPMALPGAGHSNWTFVVPSIADGRYTLYVRAGDRVGQYGYALRGPFNVDTVVPTLVLPTLPEFYFGTFFSLDGTSEPFANVTFVAAGGQTATTQAAANGSFHLVLPMDEGLNVFTMRTLDAAGNGQTILFTILVDLVAPSLAVLLDSVVYTNISAIVVSGYAEPGVSVKVNGLSATLVGADFSLNYGLAAGLNALTVTATDAAGNTATWVGAAWYDDQPPQLTVVITTGNVTEDGIPVTRQGQVSVTGQVTDNLPNNIGQVIINATSVSLEGDGQFIFSAPVVEGDNTITISATDKVGNTRRVTMHVIRDSTLPTAVVTLAAGDSPLIVDGSTTYTRGNTVVVVVLMSEDGVATVAGHPSAVTAGENRFTIDLQEGTNNVLVSYKDRAGNTGTPQGVSVIRDTTAPVVVITAPNFGSVISEDFVVIEGTAEPGAVVKINNLTASVSTSGAFSKSMTLDPAQNTFTIVATDARGNSNTTTIRVTRAQGTVNTAQGDITFPLLLLVIGLAAGAGVGFMLRGGRGGGDGSGPHPAASPDLAEPGAGPGGEDETPAYSPAPKGPRGPAPPPY